MIPEGVEEDYKEWLNESEGKKLVILKDGELIASCGCIVNDGYISLLFGLVKPEYQNQGLGGLMLALRSMYLPKANETNLIFLCPTNNSVRYYEKYGFREFKDDVESLENIQEYENYPVYRPELKLPPLPVDTERMWIVFSKRDTAFMKKLIQKTFQKGQ